MERLSQRYPDDREAAIFYALALNATALPTDKTYANQLKAASSLEKVFAEQPQHPGVAHYLIHDYDYPLIAERGISAARRRTVISATMSPTELERTRKVILAKGPRGGRRGPPREAARSPTGAARRTRAA